MHKNASRLIHALQLSKLFNPSHPTFVNKIKPYLKKASEINFVGFKYDVYSTCAYFILKLC